jgi:hypothetical protein
MKTEAGEPGLAKRGGEGSDCARRRRDIEGTLRGTLDIRSSNSGAPR